MKLTDLEPRFLRREADDRWQEVGTIQEANGILFLCPKCWTENKGPVGTHAVLCWDPSVPQTTRPGPGRWKLVGTGFQDLSLVASPTSVSLTDGCKWHGLVTNGEIISV